VPLYHIQDDEGVMWIKAGDYTDAITKWRTPLRLGLA
jgi:hypothetical protein